MKDYRPVNLTMSDGRSGAYRGAPVSDVCLCGFAEAARAVTEMSFPRIWCGGDWNPDQWPREVWERHIELFKQAHINIVTLPVFSWALLQPEEERYGVGWLEEVLHALDKSGIRVCLATSTAAVPAWMA